MYAKDAKNRTVIHTFASHLAINGTPIFTIQKLLNHSDIKMTMRYAKLAPDSGKMAIEELYKGFMTIIQTKNYKGKRCQI